MDTPLRHIGVDVLSHKEGSTIIRLSGYRMPLLVLHPEALAELKAVGEAVALRVQAGDNAADAIRDLVATLRALTSDFDIEASKVSEYFDQKGKTDPRDALQELDAEMLALKQLGNKSAGT